MSFKILADTFSVTRGETDFVQIKTLKSPHSPDEVWVAFSMNGDSKAARSFFETLIMLLEEIYFEKSEADAYERFEHSLREINAAFKALKEKKGSAAIKSINALIGIFSGNNLHLTQSCEAEAYLIRNTQPSLISEGLSAKSEDLFMNIASGELLPEDKVIFSTSRLLRLMTRSQLSELCKDGVAESADALRETVMNDSELSIAVACTHLKPSRQNVFEEMATPRDYTGFFRQGWESAISWIEEKWGNQKQPLNKKLILGFLAGVIVILVLGVTLVGNQNRKKELREEYRLRIEAMNQDLLTASTRGYADDKDTANALLNKVEQEAKQILESEYFREEVLGLLDKAQRTRDGINNTIRTEPTAPYADLALKAADINALGMTHLDDHLFVYESNRIHEVILDQLSDAKLTGLNESVIDAEAIQDQDVIAFLTSSGKILEYEAGEFRMATTADETWQKASGIGTYGRNLYLLSPSQNQIYKYSRLRSSYAAGAEYNVDANLEGAKAMAIDGNVYVLKEGGEILKLLKGEQQDFVVEDMGTDLSDANDLFTSADHNNLYVLDSVGKKVVVIEKDTPTGGRYKSQIFFENLPEVKSIYVPKDENSLYLLTTTAIYRVDI